MRIRAGYFGCAALCALLAVAPAQAQTQDTLGVTDTLSFGQAEEAAGRQVSIPVIVLNDAECVSLTIPVAYAPDELTADSVTFTGGRIAHFSFTSQTVDPARGRLLINGTQFAGPGLTPGRGAVAWLHFTLSDQVTAGSALVIDTGFFSDQGRLLFLGGAGGSYAYMPAVVPGGVNVLPPNHPPTFLTAGEYSVREGDSLFMAIVAGDVDGDLLHLRLLNRPAGARFADLGSGAGQLSWQPPYTGPYSAAGSPLELTFAADDGRDVTLLRVPVHVVNVNRPPVLYLDDTVRTSAYQPLQWDVEAVDPDLDPVTLTVAGMPEPAVVSSGNPLQIQWQPVQADTGTYPVVFRATDPEGGLTEKTAILRISPGDRVAFQMDTVSGYSDQIVRFTIHMKNLEPITGIELLIYLDPTAVIVTSVNRAGSRIEPWEMFAVSQNHNGRPGDIQIVARADVNDGFPTPPLEAGEGPIVNLDLHLIPDEGFAGLSFPARFVFRTALANTALDAAGVPILQDEIEYTHGEVQIQLYENKLPGDINLNGLAFEVGDVVYFANYFSNPVAYPLSFEQRANSDVNGDGTPATIADLVYMINVIAGGGAPRLAPHTSTSATWQLDDTGELTLASDRNLGGVLVRYRGLVPTDPTPGPAIAGMTVRAGQEGELRRLVVYSRSGQTIDPSAGPLCTGLLGAEIVSVEAADPAGQVVTVAARATLPEAPRLLGNYPNPFNPSTSIRFGLSTPGEVEIEIYNILGHLIRTLTGRFEAGEHELAWDGRDALGRPAASGVYLYRLTYEGFNQTRRMLLLK